MESRQVPVIVVFSHIIGLPIIRTLGKEGIPIVAVHYQDNEFSQYSKYVSRRYKMTSPQIDEAKFIEELSSLSGNYKGALLVPADDSAVIPLSKYKNKLAAYFKVAVNDWEIANVCIEKQKTYELAEELSIPCPQTAFCNSLEHLPELSKEFSFPFLLKPSQSHLFFRLFKQKAFVINNDDDLLFYSGLLNKFNLSFVLQEIIPGPPSNGVNYNSYMINHVPVAEFTAQKIRIDPPFFGSPRVIVSRKIPEIIEPGRKLLAALNYEGFSCVEFKKDQRDQVYKLMEINARPNLSGALAVRAGINFPLIMYEHLVKGNILASNSFIENIYWIDLQKDLYRFFTSKKIEGISFSDYIRPYKEKHIFAVLSLSDPGPFRHRTWLLLKELLFGKT